MPLSDDTQALLNIADQLPASERQLLYQQGYEDGLHNQRGDFLDSYHTQHPLAASDTYLQGYTEGKAVAAFKHQEED